MEDKVFHKILEPELTCNSRKERAENDVKFNFRINNYFHSVLD